MNRSGADGILRLWNFKSGFNRQNKTLSRQICPFILWRQFKFCLLVRKGPKLELRYDRIDKRLYTGQLTGPGTGQGWINENSVIFLPRNCYSWDGNKVWRIALAGKAQARRRGDGETDQSDRGWGGWENASMRRTQPKASSEVTRSDTKQSIISKLPRD